MCKQNQTLTCSPPANLELTTVHCKCSQTHRVSLPSSSQNLAAKCASKIKPYRLLQAQIWNSQQFTASARKHTEYLYPVVHKTSLQNVQAKTTLTSLHPQIWNSQQFTASARKHTEYLYPVVHETSLQNVQAKTYPTLFSRRKFVTHNSSLQVLATTPSISTQ